MGKQVSEPWLPARQGLRRARAQRNSLGGELQGAPPSSSPPLSPDPGGQAISGVTWEHYLLVGVDREPEMYRP